jgi:tRNA threonylcarbamoyladenosine biosynthesis protein TsaE
MQKQISDSPQTTKEIAGKLALDLRIGSIICLSGNLGSGKTVFTKGFASALGVKENCIKSPTYTFVREYKKNTLSIFHFDFYRVLDGDDLIFHEMESIMETKNAFFIIEWPERVESFLKKKKTVDVKLEYIDSSRRKISINK